MKEQAFVFAPIGFLFNTPQGIVHITTHENVVRAFQPDAEEAFVVDTYFYASTHGSKSFGI